ncbi:MAG: hypothetical protein KGI82_00390 [Betaproteobacteria bacterium]|nr:hypothetical protein [Betaproteobacteria bacterium]
MNFLSELFASDPLPETPPKAAPVATQASPRIDDRLQTTLRQIGILAIIGGIAGGFWNATQYQTDIGFLFWAENIGEGIVLCVVLYALAAIVDALRVIAANSSKDGPKL